MKSPLLKILCTGAVLFTWMTASGSGQESISGKLVVLKAIHEDMNTRVGPPANFVLQGGPLATFEVTYNGFPDEAEAAFQYAVDIWATEISSPVTIRVTANWTPLDPNVLGSAGPTFFFGNFPGAPLSETWYAVALAEQLSGNDLNSPTEADIEANFNSDFANWYFGTDGDTPSGEFDFVSVVLHELCHGLGFVGSMTVSEGIGSWGFKGFPDIPVIYDVFPVNVAGEKLIDTNIFPNPSAELGTQLTSDNIFFDGPNAVAANGGTAPKLYLPATWEEGSSYSHLDESTFPAGDPNSLMTPSIGMAEGIHSPGVITLGIYKDMGWTLLAVSTEEEPSSLPVAFVLSQNYPNPFNPVTTMEYVLPRSADVSLTVYNLLGREVAVLASGVQSAGVHRLWWEGMTTGGAPVASGLYFYRLEARDPNSGQAILLGQTKKMVLLR